MPFVRIRVDEKHLHAIDQATGNGDRAEFIRRAITAAIREAEDARARFAYAAQPDSESEADDWSKCEEFKA